LQEVKRCQRKTVFHCPRLTNTLDTLAGANWFSTLDLKSRYWQVDVHLDDGENHILDQSRIMAVYSHVLWPLQRSCDIWKANGDSPARSHIRFMSCVLRQHNHNWPQFPRTPGQPAKSVSVVPRSCLKLNPEKCQLFQKEAWYFRHLVSPGGITTDPKKLKALREWPTPKNKHKVRSFWELCTYYIL
jgi:hypothetical protein